MKILIIRFSSIGDIVLTTPVIRVLRKKFPDAVLHYCTKKQYSGILKANPYLNHIFELDRSLDHLITDLKKERYDLVIDLHHNLRTRILTFRLGVKTYRFPKLNLQKWLLVNFKINLMPNVHIVDRYLSTLSELGVDNDEQGLDYFIPENDEVESDWLPESHRKEFVVFAVGAKFNTKKLPLEKMIQLCDQINKPVILIGGKEDQENASKIENFFRKQAGSKPYEEKLRELNKKTEIFNACGKFNLNQSASVIRQATYVFTHDTGMMHVAAAFGKDIYSVWGSTTLAFGMYPYRTRFTVFENNKLNCRPCSKIGYAKCPLGHFKCMNEVNFDFYLK